MFLTVGLLTVAQPQTAGRVSPHHNCERCQCSAGHAQVKTHQLQRSRRRRVLQLSSFARLVERYSEGVETQGTPLTWSSSKCVIVDGLVVDSRRTRNKPDPLYRPRLAPVKAIPASRSGSKLKSNPRSYQRSHRLRQEAWKWLGVDSVFSAFLNI
ncbi:unnamed protein product [Laminaria digitata]